MKELRKMFYLIRYRINFTIYNIVATCHNCFSHRLSFIFLVLVLAVSRIESTICVIPCHL